jgi:hypothetical protein
MNIETFSVSCNITKHSRDYELETLLEAVDGKNAAKIFLQDWIEDIFQSLMNSKEKSLVIAVSHPNGFIEYFEVRNNFLRSID